MKNLGIDYDYVFRKIKEKLIAVSKEDIDTFGDISLHVSKERQFIDRSDLLKHGSVFVSVNFGSAEMRLNMAEFSVSFEVIAEQGTLEKARELLSRFAKENSMSYLEDPSSRYAPFSAFQVYDTPETMEDYAEIGNGYRALLAMEGTIVIGEGAFNVSLVDVSTGKKINYLSLNLSFSSDVRPLPFPNEKGFATSKIGFSTFGFSVSMIANYDDGEGLNLFSRLQEIAFGLKDASTTFAFKLGYLGKEVTQKYVLQDFKVTSNVGQPVAYQCAFALAEVR